MLIHVRASAVVCALVLLSTPAAKAADEDLAARADDALRKAVTFFRDQVSTEGGYLWRYSSDLSLREGEGKVDDQTAWVQPPGTPAVGLALLEAWERTGHDDLLDAARDAGGALVRGQLQSGGWHAAIHFDPDRRRKHAYRVDGPPAKKARNISALDDGMTQSALRLLMRLDRATGFKDQRLHEAVTFALDALLAAQHPNGAWSQVFDGPVDRSSPADLRASFPDEWPREHPGGDYWWHYTFNDNALADTIEVMLEAAEVYDDAGFRAAALRAGRFILLAQLPEPQPAWAQQYDRRMRPAWARKFEPPAVSGGETQGVLRTLMTLYRATGDAAFLEPIPRALAWMRRSALPDGRLARFYELKTNRPLYFTRDYKLTHDDRDPPTHYAFRIKSDVDEIEKAYLELREADARSLRSPFHRPLRAASFSATKIDRVREVIASMDARGAWVEEGALRFHKKKGPVIESATFIKNVGLLSEYLQSSRAR